MTDTKQLLNFDVRVRNRCMKAGSITSEDVARYMKEMVDVQDNAEEMGIAQPGVAAAANQPAPAAAQPASGNGSTGDEFEDEI